MTWHSQVLRTTEEHWIYRASQHEVAYERTAKGVGEGVLVGRTLEYSGEIARELSC